MEAKIILSYNNELEAKTVAKAVSPDNFEVPHGLFINTTFENSKVLTVLKCDLNLRTFISTIDDLLSCFSTAEKAFTSIKRK